MNSMTNDTILDARMASDGWLKNSTNGTNDGNTASTATSTEPKPPAMSAREAHRLRLTLAQMLQHILIEYAPLFLAGDRLQNMIEFAGDNLDSFLFGGRGLEMLQQAVTFASCEHRQERIHDSVNEPPGKRSACRIIISSMT